MPFTEQSAIHCTVRRPFRSGFCQPMLAQRDRISPAPEATQRTQDYGKMDDGKELRN
jgi:hypothetical protein